MLSSDRVYRYSLSRKWDDSRRSLVVIGLNPSTADEETDDPTIRRCVGFAQREGYGGLHMLNMFALRSTDPDQLLTHADPVGPENHLYLQRAAQANSLVLAAWGAVAKDFPSQARYVCAVFHGKMRCLGITKDGHPRHPLYVRADEPLREYTRR
jgi:hypothetical protein